MTEVLDQIRDIYTSSDHSKIRHLIANHFIPSETEKKKNAEIPTPVKLVDEMLDKIRKPFWTKPRPVFEPCCGKGNFVLAIFDRFYNGLKNKYPVPAERCRVIIEECIYYADITEMNVFITTEILKCHIQSYSGDEDIEVKFNSYVGDTLKLDIDNVWGLYGFDAVIGNPPYQKENKKSDSARGGRNNSLYLDFVNNSLSVLKKEGYLLFIHPLNWRKIGSKIFKEFINRNIVYLKLNYGSDFFENVSVKTDYYVLKNSNEENYKSVVEYVDKKKKCVSSSVILSKALKFIPNVFNEYINSILEKVSLYGKQYECIISSDCHKTRSHVNKGETEVYKFPLYNTSGNQYDYFSSKEHKNQKSKKVILSNSGKLCPFYDDGNFGTTQDAMYILVDSKEEGGVIVNTIKSGLFVFLIKICQWGNFRNEASLFSYFRYPDRECIDVLKYYNISEEEEDFMKDNLV